MPNLAVIGHPVAHSRSPVMQTAALTALGLAGEWSYGAIDLEPEQFEAEVAALAWAQPVAELIDGPQVDARRVERETEPVVDAGVFAEAMQEDDRDLGLRDRPVPVVRAAGLNVQKWHDSDCTR